MIERTSSVLLYLDVIIVLIVAIPALALGAPALGYAVGAGAWILGRVGSNIAEKRIAAMDDVKRQIGWGLTSSMGRVWLLAAAIVIVGVMGSREDGLTAALVIFGAFSLYFVRSAVGLMTNRRSKTA